MGSSDAGLVPVRLAWEGVWAASGLINVISEGVCGVWAQIASSEITRYPNHQRTGGAYRAVIGSGRTTILGRFCRQIACTNDEWVYKPPFDQVAALFFT